MFYSLSPRCLVLSILLFLGIWCSLTSCDDDEEKEEAPHEPDPELGPTSAEEEEPVPEPHTVDDRCLVPSEATKEKCCKNNFEIDDVFMKCLRLNKKKKPQDMKKDAAETFKFFSCLIECFYKSKKYVGRGDSLNMKIVKADAKKKYKGQTDKIQHYVKMYEHCQRHGKTDFNELKSNPAAKFLLKGTCKPYFVFVHTCIMTYWKISCPYYTWLHNKEYKVDCEELKTKCEEVHG